MPYRETCAKITEAVEAMITEAQKARLEKPGALGKLMDSHVIPGERRKFNPSELHGKRLPKGVFKHGEEIWIGVNECRRSTGVGMKAIRDGKEFFAAVEVADYEFEVNNRPMDAFTEALRRADALLGEELFAR